MSVSAMANVNNSLLLYYVRVVTNQFTNPCTYVQYHYEISTVTHFFAVRTVQILNSNSFDSRVIIGLLVGKQQTACW